MAAILWDIVTWVYNFPLPLICKFSKISLHNVLKNMSNTLIFELNKKDFIRFFLLYSKCSHFSVTNFDILIFFNILHLEMNLVLKYMLQNIIHLCIKK